MEGVLDALMAMSYQGLCTRRATRLLEQRAGVLIAHTLLFIFGCGGETRPVTLDVRTDLVEELRDYVEESFERAHPEVDVRLTVATTEESTADLLAGVSREAPFDVWWGAEAAGLERVADEGRLLPYSPIWLDEPSLVIPDTGAAWHPLLIPPYVIAFSRDDLPLTRAPTDWNDLRHFRWSEEIELLDPLRSESGALFLLSMLARYEAEVDTDAGFDWLITLDRQVDSYAATPGDAVRALGVTASRLAVLPRADAEEARATDAPWLYYRLPESGTPILARGVAVVRGTDAVEAARAFVDHVGALDVRTVSKLQTRWQPAYGDVDASRLPADFELTHPWQPWALAVDRIEAQRDIWLDRWEQEIQRR